MNGTIFLDEIAEMPNDTQAYLLRVLESGEFIRVGASKSMKTDVRVIAATNVNLEEAVRKGKFREDLFYRLNTVPIRVPSLKERPEDITLLFRRFAGDFAEKYRMQPVRLDERAEVLKTTAGLETSANSKTWQSNFPSFLKNDLLLRKPCSTPCPNYLAATCPCHRTPTGLQEKMAANSRSENCFIRCCLT